jgi:streptogramin lyase
MTRESSLRGCAIMWPGAVAFAILALIGAGCGSSSSGSRPVPLSTLSGVVTGSGPQNPIGGATVTLYAVGQSGYYNTALGTATSSAAGTWTLAYACPATAVQTYVTAVGGSVGSGTNSAIALMAATGPCGELSSGTPSFVSVNALTTMAAAWAAAQFSDATGANLGASATNAEGLANALEASIANLATSVLYEGGAPGNTGVPAPFLAKIAPSCNTGNPDPNCDGLERLDTLANILAFCVNTSAPASAQCSALLANTGGSKTTLQAAHVMATNPAANVAAIYNIKPPSGMPLFTPTLANQPADFTLALNFNNTNEYGANFDGPFGMAVDANGNVWVANNGGNTVTLLSSSGHLLGNFSNLNCPIAVAIAASGTVWVPNYIGDSLTALTANGGLIGNFAPSGANFQGPAAVAIDTAGNAWVPNLDGNSVTELSSTGTLLGNFAPSGANFNGPVAVAIDASDNVWIPNLSGNSVTELSKSGAVVGNFAPGGANFDVPFAIAIGASGNIWVPNNNGNSVTVLNSSGGLVGNFAPSGAFDGPGNLAIDAAGTAWVSNCGGYCSGSTSNGSVSAVNAQGGLLGNFAPQGANFDAPSAIAVDAAGNIWVENDNGNSVSEVIGLAAPVKTPLGPGAPAKP